MSDPADMLISVRGEARRAVPPDYGTMSAVIEVTRDSKAAAVHTAAEDLDGLTTDLVAVGGVALEAGTERHPLTWSAQSVTTLIERAHDEATGRHEPTGRVTALVELLITVRAFDLLDRLGAVLTSYETVRVRHIEWDADWDNPAWPDVRAAAIAAAIAKGRDYATALGGSLLAVEHIADGGLLGGSDGHFRATSAAFGRASHARGAEDRGLPSLDPVPQELTAVIEARLVADGVSLSAL
jgi:hypothetical protein